MAVASPICTAGSLIAGECVVGLTVNDHFTRGVSPVFINGVPMTTWADKSTGHTGYTYVGPTNPGVLANTLDGLVPVLPDPGLSVPAKVFVNGVPVVKAGDKYFVHPNPLDIDLFHEVNIAVASFPSVFAS